MIKYTNKEKLAIVKILVAHNSILELGDKRLQYNNGELSQAIHVLQSFVKQHVLNRLDPEEWSDWWGDDDDKN